MSAELDAQLGVVALLTASLEHDEHLVVEQLEALVGDVGEPAFHFAMFWALGALIVDVAELRNVDSSAVVQALARIAVTTTTDRR